MDTQDFIERIKKYPILYNRRHREYTNLVKKAKIWEDIAKNMDIPVDQLKIKWKGLKDSYNKYQKGNEGISRSTTKYNNWCWGPHMTFLDDCGGIRRTKRYISKPSQSPGGPVDTSLHQPTIKVQVSDEDEDVESTSQTFVTPSSTMLRSFKPLRCNSLLIQSDEDEENTLENKRKKQTDAVDHLFTSYCETFKKFSVCTQAQLKVEMAKLFAGAEVQEYNQNK